MGFRGRYVTIQTHGAIDHSTALATAVLDDLSDVSLAGQANNDVMLRAGGVWTPATLAEAIAAGSAVNFNDLTDVDLTGAADGDLLVRSGGSWVDIGGTNGHIMQRSAGAWSGAALGSLHAAEHQATIVRRAANQSINGSTHTAVSWDTEDHDSLGAWVVGTPTDVTIPAGKGGLYVATMWAEFQSVASPSGNRIMRLLVNAVATPISNLYFPAVANQRANGAAVFPLRLAAADVVTMTVWHSEGTAKDLQAAHLGLTRISE